MSNKHYIDALEVETTSLDELSQSTCPQCGAIAIDGEVPVCEGGSPQDCSMEIYSGVMEGDPQPLRFE